MTLDEWQRRAVGVPFVPDGRDYDGWDCWGLVVRAYRDVLGVDVPDYAWGDTRALIRQFADRGTAHWRPVATPAPMAIAGIFRRGRVIHAGLYVGRRRIMHVEQGIETCAESVSNMRVEGWYVPREG